jgi:hypothetical protein
MTTIILKPAALRYFKAAGWWFRERTYRSWLQMTARESDQ